MSAPTCTPCGRVIEWSAGAGCWVAPNQALPPACGTTENGVRGTVRGHSAPEAEGGTEAVEWTVLVEYAVTFRAPVGASAEALSDAAEAVYESGEMSGPLDHWFPDETGERR